MIASVIHAQSQVDAEGGADERARAFAERYARYWEPVLAPAGRRLLDALGKDGLLSEPALAVPGNQTLLDVGTGTGLLALEAAQRWPRARIVGVDPSRPMLSVARRRATGIAAAKGRLELYEASAHRLPFPDEAVDLVVSSFVLQLVPDRLVALRETYRILRPGGLLGYVTWIKADESFAPRGIVDEELESAGIGRGRPTRLVGDVASPAAAASQLRRAGFRRVRAWQEELTRRWAPAAYLEYIQACRDANALASLDNDARSALLGRIRRRLAELGPDDFRWAAPICFTIGRRAA